jgi:hypothetical protein
MVDDSDSRGITKSSNSSSLLPPSVSLLPASAIAWHTHLWHLETKAFLSRTFGQKQAWCGLEQIHRQNGYSVSIFSAIRIFSKTINHEIR